MVLISKNELSKRLSTRYSDGIKTGEEKSANKVKDLQKQVRNLNDQIEEANYQHEKSMESLRREIGELEDKVAVYESQKEDAQANIKKELELESLEVKLNAKKDQYDEVAAALKDRENKLLDKEDKAQKSAYADGLADGLRKAHEITEKDRENAMKIAMVSAASHTPTETMKELNNVHQLTAGSKTK